MKSILKHIVWVLLWLTVLNSYSQQSPQSNFADSVLSYAEFISAVEQYHPVANMARLEYDLAQEYLRSARGGFDPTISGDLRKKTWSETDYYTARSTQLEVPTWMGLKFGAGWEQNDGLFLNPESSVPDAGLVHAGVSLDLGAGLLMDNRRAALRQAEIGLELGDIDRQLALNQLYVEATQAYFSWALSEEMLSVAQEAVRLAEVRYEAVRESYRLGDVPAIDTAEAYTQVLNRLFVLREQQTRWAGAIHRAGAYLWYEDALPVDIPPNVKPISLSAENVEESPVEGLMISADHPQLRRVAGRRDISVIQRRLAAEYLKPEVALKYNFLTRDLATANPEQYFADSRFFANNYTFGATVNFPIFLRDARGKVGQARVNIEMIDREFENQMAVLEAELKAAFAEWSNLQDQIDFYSQNVELQQQLLDGEIELFRNGESSLFMVNARETALINIQQTLLQLVARSEVLQAELREIAGLGF